jgi:hypothetical protein
LFSDVSGSVSAVLAVEQHIHGAVNFGSALFGREKQFTEVGKLETALDKIGLTHHRVRSRIPRQYVFFGL